MQLVSRWSWQGHPVDRASTVEDRRGRNGGSRIERMDEGSLGEFGGRVCRKLPRGGASTAPPAPSANWRRTASIPHTLCVCVGSSNTVRTSVIAQCGGQKSLLSRAPRGWGCKHQVRSPHTRRVQKITREKSEEIPNKKIPFPTRQKLVSSPPRDPLAPRRDLSEIAC